jgi:hypothetical protein
MAYSLFQVSLGQSFNADFVNSQASFVNNFNNPGAGTFVLLSGQSKYLAYWSQKNGPPDRIAVDSDFYGWARFTNISGTLVVADSATADSGGIIVGTLEQVPEPSSALLFGLGSLCLFSRRRGK